MALDAEMLTRAGIPEEHHEEILKGHNETVAGLRAEVERYKNDAEEAEKYTKEQNHYKSEYERLETEFEGYRTQIRKKEVCRELLEDLGFNERMVNRLYDKPQLLSLFELDINGYIKDSYELETRVLEDFGDTIKGERTPRANRSRSKALERIRRRGVM